MVCVVLPRESWKNGSGKYTKAFSSGSALSMEAGPTPLSFNWGEHYMEETPVRVEALIAAKEFELIHEYETH